MTDAPKEIFGELLGWQIPVKKMKKEKYFVC